MTHNYMYLFPFIYTTSKFNKRLGVTNLLIIIIIILFYSIKFDSNQNTTHPNENYYFKIHTRQYKVYFIIILQAQMNSIECLQAFLPLLTVGEDFSPTNIFIFSARDRSLSNNTQRNTIKINRVNFFSDPQSCRIKKKRLCLSFFDTIMTSVLQSQLLKRSITLVIYFFSLIFLHYYNLINDNQETFLRQSSFEMQGHKCEEYSSVYICDAVRNIIIVNWFN